MWSKLLQSNLLFAGSFASMIALIFVFAFALLNGSVEVCGTSISTSDNIVLEIKGQGRVQGNSDTTAWTKQKFMQYRGVPYAESPKGPLRFKAPVARKPWSNVLDATNWGRRCPVITTVNKESASQISDDVEDCLNLCVYSKNLNSKKPVMMYIHGGGFYNGTSLDHPAHYLMEKDIVLVVPQYRIGALGFVSSKTDEIPGNAAIADMILALKWIQDHIATFGGDPENVTIFGQSAGAAIVGALLLSTQVPSNHFQRAIMQSGSILASWATTTKSFEQVQRICRNLECEHCENEKEVNSCLMNATVFNLLNATKNETISPVISDKLGILPEHPIEMFSKTNKSADVMIGFTKHDGSYVVSELYKIYKKLFGNATLNVRQLVSFVLSDLKDPTKLTNNLNTRVFFNRETLDSYDHKKAIPRYFDLASVIYFKSPALALTSELFRRNFSRPYLYTFDYEGEYTRFGYERGNEHFPFNGGVHHSNDNIYLFSTHTPLNEKDANISKKMVDIWTSFAIDGKPSTDSTEIPPMETESGPYFHINENIKVSYDVFDEFTTAIDDPENHKLIRNNISFLKNI